MKYKFKVTEYELEKAEQDKAKFLLATGNKHNTAVIKGQGNLMVGLERAALEQFKDNFFTEVRIRLGLPYGKNALSITNDGKKLVLCEVINY